MRSAKDIKAALQAAFDQSVVFSNDEEVRGKVDPLVTALLEAMEARHRRCTVIWQKIVTMCSSAMFDERLNAEKRAQWQLELRFQTNWMRGIALKAMEENTIIPADLDDLAPELDQAG